MFAVNTNKFTKHASLVCTVHIVAPKLAHFYALLTSSNIDQFSNFFHCQNQNICISTINKAYSKGFLHTIHQKRSFPARKCFLLVPNFLAYKYP